jgi:tetratricopeptide (TPR) repeat protein
LHFIDYTLAFKEKSMRRPGIIVVAVAVLSFVLISAYVGSTRSALAKESTTVTKGDLKELEERLNREMDSNLSQTQRETEFYKTIATQYHDSSEKNWTIIFAIIAVMTLFSSYSIFKGGKTDEEVKQLLSSARLEVDQIRKIREEVEKSAKGAKSSEYKSKAIEHIMEGNRLREQGQYQEAIAAFDKAIELDPKHSTPYNNKGSVLNKLGKYEEAIAAYDKAIELDPKNAFAYNNKGVVLGNADKYVEAFALFDKAIELDPKYAMAYTNKGNVLNHLGRNKEAIAVCDKAIGIDPKLAIAYIVKGSVLEDLGKHEEAVASYDKAIALDPKDAGAHNNKGRSLISLKRYDDSIISIKESLNLEPDGRYAHLNMALALQKRNGPGDADKAKEILNNLLKENNNNDVAARAYALLGERDKMLSLVRTLVEEKPLLKQIFRTALAFEAYRDDPEFKAIVGE